MMGSLSLLPAILVSHALSIQATDFLLLDQETVLGVHGVEISRINGGTGLSILLHVPTHARRLSGDRVRDVALANRDFARLCKAIVNQAINNKEEKPDHIGFRFSDEEPSSDLLVQPVLTQTTLWFRVRGVICGAPTSNPRF